jgi:DNA polymerase bacteriophage-type
VPLVFRDIETRSTVDLKDVGQSAYAQHPTTEVWCVAFALDDDPVKIWRPGLPVPREFKRTKVVAVAHNAAFEMAIERHILGPRFGFPVIAVERNRCTMAQASACALPGKLEKVAEVLRLKHQKDAVGARLMKAMAKPRKATKDEDPNGVYWLDDAEHRARLEAYCATDTEATRELFHVIPRLSDDEQTLWVLDQKINGHGFHLDAGLAEAAQRVTADAFPAIDAELAEVTGGGVTAVNQIAKLQAWLQESCGLAVPDINKKTVEELLTREDLSPCARRAIELRALGAQAAVKKVRALLNRREADGRVRGSFIYHAAGTGRWSSRGAQVHNLKRHRDPSRGPGARYQGDRQGRLPAGVQEV